MTDAHLNHEVDIVTTPHLRHHAKLVCVECNGLWLQWLSRKDTSTLLGMQQPKKKLHNKKTHWSMTKLKERQHYQSFQPPSLQLPRTPTQLINDRLALNGYSRYNGNSIFTIPIPYLQSLLDTNKVNRKEDRQLIQAAIDQRQIGA